MIASPPFSSLSGSAKKSYTPVGLCLLCGLFEHETVLRNYGLHSCSLVLLWITLAHWAERRPKATATESTSRRSFISISFAVSVSPPKHPANLTNKYWCLRFWGRLCEFSCGITQYRSKRLAWKVPILTWVETAAVKTFQNLIREGRLTRQNEKVSWMASQVILSKHPFQTLTSIIDMGAKHTGPHTLKSKSLILAIETTLLGFYDRQQVFQSIGQQLKR